MNSQGGGVAIVSPGKEDHEAESADAGTASPEAKNKSRIFSKLSTATKKLLGAVVTLAVIAGGGATVYQVFFTGGTSKAQVGYLDIDRSPVLGMQFRQNGSIVPMTYRADGSTDIVTVSLLSQPFELLLPALQSNYALGINVRYNSSGFDLQDGASVDNNPSFRPGTGMANYEYGDGSLIVTADAQNYFIGTRVEQESDGMQGIYIASTGPSGSTPLTKQRNNLYLTMFRQAVNAVIFGSGTYEYFILKFH
jgi:hypothetical protein